jgi:hypothetical protein
MRPYLKKNPSQERAGGVAQGVGPDFKPQCHQQKKKEKRKEGRGRRRVGKEEEKKLTISKIAQA